jgi:hypothetical protein
MTVILKSNTDMHGAVHKMLATGKVRNEISSRTDGDFCHQRRDTEIAPKI